MNAVKEIIDYVNDVANKTFIFGNIAFSHIGEDKINIGSKLEVGAYCKQKDCNGQTLEDKLSQKNKLFGKDLNEQLCYSTTKYLENRKIKVLSLSFLNQGQKLLKLDPINKSTNAIEIRYKNENDINIDMFKGLEPIYFNDYDPPKNTEMSAVEAFVATLKHYHEFHTIVQTHLYQEEKVGYIYLIRPEINIGENYAALAYMYLLNSLDYKDIEIISQKLSLYFLGILKEKAKVESIKSAKAAIMSRNISHNLGSHVMAYMKHDLSSVEDMLKNGVLMNALPCEEIEEEVYTNKEIPYLVGIGKFISYLQERQDYIATVSTDYIPYPSIVNFKDAIYDELNPDYRFQRHTEWKGHKPANILLENIAKSEGLSRKTLKEKETQVSNNILIQYREFNGLNGTSSKKDYEDLRKWNFSLPGGIMGRQAVFSIVENVIRNAAKHGTRKSGANLSLTFNIIDPLEGLLEEDEEFWNPYKVAHDKNDLYIVTLTDNIVTDLERVKVINKVLTSPFSGDGFDLAASNKGLKEMVISAAWLRNIHIEKQTSDELAPIIKARRTKEGYLQYVFCLPRVKEVALITDRFNDNNSLCDNVTNLMKRCGWSIFSVEEFCKLSNKDYSFIIIDPDLQKEAKDAQKQSVVETIRKCSHNRYYNVKESTDIVQHYIKTNLFNELPEYKTAEKFKDAELELYAQLAGDSNFIIAIADINVDGTYDENFESHSEFVKILHVEKDEVDKYTYVYRKHNDTKKQFDQFIDLYQKSYFYEKLAFVEGITGGNSTDRLVRHMYIDNLWAYKQIHAMRTKVAIFDERIFTKVTGYEKTDLTTPTEEGWRDKLVKLNNIDEAKEQVLKYHDESNYDIIKDDIFEVFDSLQTIEDVISFAEKYCPLEKSYKKNDGLKSMVYHKKGIDVYTITEEEDGQFNIWGFVPNKNLENDYGKIEKVGCLKVDPNEKEAPSIKMIINDYTNYHYLSIHQGLLDKIYKVIDPEKKRTVTKELHNKFVICPKTEEDDYLQGLIIHSGRSKPNTKDMPQHQPFVQYSAIENAFFDCKYTLVELLDSACYE